jgi:serine/threonine protein kinase
MKDSLGYYRILEKIGAGGMGEVYRAEDTRLGRKVALKILPPELDASPERLHRFESEAHAIAALNHPNIVTIYSVEESEGIRFISMELVRGKTLGGVDRLGLKQFFDVAIPLTDGIATAHLEGIVHRDLKPENVMVTDTGVVKILDFGLAKMRATAGGDGDSGVMTKSMTSPGIVVGTVSYMSPEQAEGKTVDARSDLFTLGIIFYRLLAGRHPFPGDSAASVLSAILRDTPEYAGELDSRVPYELSRIIRRCLEKGLTRRYQSALDLRNDLQEVALDLESGELQKRSTVPTRYRRRFPRILPWALAVALIALASVAFFRRDRVPPLPERRFVLKPLMGQMRGMVLSRDGSMWAAPAQQGGVTSLFLHSPGQFEPHPLVGTLWAYWPTFSPDG